MGAYRESLDAKKQERMKRFGSLTTSAMEAQSTGGLTAEELESKRKARLERFGAAEVKESQDSLALKLNRRRAKMLRKGSGGKSLIVDAGDGDGQKKQKNRDNIGGRPGGKRNNKFGNNGQKRFKRGGNRD